MYVVIEKFIDLEDSNYQYYPGDVFPRENTEVDIERVQVLSSSYNKLGKRLIAEINGTPGTIKGLEDTPDGDSTAEADNTTTDTIETVVESEPEVNEGSEKPNNRGTKKSQKRGE